MQVRTFRGAADKVLPTLVKHITQNEQDPYQENNNLP